MARPEIFYKCSKFTIVPPMADTYEFENFILNLKKSYRATHGIECFFWEFDGTNIVINEDTNTTDNDIFKQFTVLSGWLFSQNYHLIGSFYYRMGNTIEYISVNDTKFIEHFVLTDDNDIQNFYQRYPNKVILGKKVLFDAKNKINEHLKNKPLCTIKNVAGHNEKLSIIKILQERLMAAENKIKKLCDKSSFIWKICMATNLFIVAAILFSCVMVKIKTGQK